MDSALQNISQRIRNAAASKNLLRIRGGGSKDFYGQSLQGDVLDTTPLRGIVSYEPSELVVTVGAGTPLVELQAELAKAGQCLPFEPPHFGANATVGGMVACGLSGPARASVGAVRDYILGVKMINGQGDILSFGGTVMKNVAGYDVSRLMAGSLGTLGVLAEVSIKVLPIAVAQATLVFEMSEAKALAQLNRWAGQPLPVNASCWYEGSLVLRLSGAQAAVAAAKNTMGGSVVDEAQAQAGWASLREQTAPFFALQRGESLVRLSVSDTTAPLNFGPTLIEWGGAQRWIKLPKKENAEKSVLGKHGRFSELNGHATLFRGGDKSRGVFTPLVAPLDRIHRELKKQFDPAGIFNRGRMFSDF